MLNEVPPAAAYHPNNPIKDITEIPLYESDIEREMIRTVILVLK